jgi:UDP-GlcNAc:undecaprenyl-phosphate GlcNAc-1-phosphate transferase
MSAQDVALFVAFTVLPSLLVALVTAFLVRRLAPRCGLVDRPNNRKVHQNATPLGGGLAIWFGVVLPFAIGQLALWLLQQESLAERIPIPDLVRPHLEGIRSQVGSLWLMLAAGTILMIVGLLDDLRELNWRLRLLIQFVVAAACVFFFGWKATAFIGIPILTGLLSVFWIVALINSFNMLDNMDGLSGGVAAIAAGGLAILMLLSKDPETGQPQLFVAGLLLVIVGALLGFLFHNRPPARIFMGDAGSYFVGFCIAVATLLATYAGYRSEGKHSVLAPLLVMAVPFYDMLSVLWIRWREGRSLFQADKCHLSHRLVDLGLSKGQAVLTIYLLTTVCTMSALLLHQVDQVGTVVLVVVVCCVLTLIAILESTARKRLT